MLPFKEPKVSVRDMDLQILFTRAKIDVRNSCMWGKTANVELSYFDTSLSGSITLLEMVEVVLYKSWKASI
jgi:hypothetical protein